ncbi:MAG: tetratricopeptide repeat protein [Burkholderiales bacterium]|nr:tetratricopeptide repeat protein [Burkholderiales bacterium]
MALHAFVAMPFGIKDGIDFDCIYAELIRPALEAGGFTAFRADEEMSAGEIRKDMFQELLLADLVVVDVSIDNPNVWYELGVRHALRARGIVVIGCRDGRLPFDIATDRVLRYHRKDGAPDPAMLAIDRAALTRFAGETMKSWYGLKESPVYELVPYLKEPDWKALKVPGANEFWDAYDNWQDRVEVARRRLRAGDILMLSEETPTWILRMEARRLAGKALMKLGHFSLAMEQFELALAIDPVDFESLCNIGVIFGRLDMHDRAKVWINDIVETNSDNPECWSLLGRVHKMEWLNRWHKAGGDSTSMRQGAAAEEALLRETINPYQAAFRADPRHYYSGVNALTLRHLLRHLDCLDDNAVAIETLEGGVRWACLTALHKNPRDYWARASLADIELLVADRAAVVRAYRNAVAAAERDWFALDSSRQQLALLRDLDFRPDIVAAALDIYARELSLISPPKPPRQAILFSGHMIDSPDRNESRFPADKEAAAAQAIAGKLDQLAAGPEDTALCGGACGGDLLFAEACLSRNVPLTLYLALPVPDFIDKSVAFAGSQWVDRFYAVKNHPRVQTLIAADELGPPPADASPFARANLWMLFTTLAYGTERARFITLWNGREGDGPGGTGDMVERMKKHSRPPYIIDPNDL